MLTFEELQKAHEGLASIDVKGKEYVMVPERVKAFRRLFPNGFIKTDILSMENGLCVMKARVGYYENEHEIVLSTGLAYEKESNGFINRFSFVENAETSAVGRALGFLALGIDGGAICSAEELANAITNQKKADEKTADQKSVIDLVDIRKQLEAAIKAKTKDMDKLGKINFINNVITPALNGERNWKLCDNPELLSNLLKTIELKAA